MQCWERIVDKTGTTYPRMLLRKIDNKKKFSFSICKLEGGVSVCDGGWGMGGGCCLIKTCEKKITLFVTAMSHFT